MEGLFVLQLLACLATFPSVSQAAVGCRTAHGGNCVAVNFTQWVCVEHYEDMMVGRDSARKLQCVSPCSSCVAIIQKRCCPQCTSLASSGEYFTILQLCCASSSSTQAAIVPMKLSLELQPATASRTPSSTTGTSHLALTSPFCPQTLLHLPTIF